MSKHTPGPWIVYPETNGSEICAVDMEPGLPIRAAIAKVDTFNYGEWIGNARLIAAAPDLLEALEELVDLFGGLVSGEYPPDGFTTQPARDAIAKAKGEGNE